MNDIRFYISDDHTLKGGVEGFASAYGNGGNTVTMVAPFLTTHTMYVLYRKPNGIAAERYVMIPTGETEIVDVDGNNEEWNIWYNVVPGAVVNIDSAVAQDLATGFEDWYFVPEDGFLGIVQFEVDLATTFPLAVEGDFARVVDTNTDWEFLSSVWVDSTTQIVGQESRERVEMVNVVVDPNIDGDLPTIAPDNTEMIITILNGKLSISDAIDTYVAQDLETAYAAAVTIALTDKIYIQTATGAKYATTAQIVAGAGGMAVTDYDAPEVGVTKSVMFGRNVGELGNSKPAQEIIDGEFEVIDYNEPGVGGKNSWSDTEQAIETIINANVTLQNGRELLKIGRNSGAPIPDLEPVAIIGSVGQTGQVEPVDITDPTQSFKTIGMMTEPIGTNETKNLATIGRVRGDFSAFTEGAELFCAVGGGLTETKPSPPNRCIRMGTLERTGVTGIFYLNPIILPNLGELSNVDLVTVAAVTNDLLIKNASEVYVPYALDNIKFSKTGFPKDITNIITIDFNNTTKIFTLSTSVDVDYYIQNVKYTLLASTPKTIDMSLIILEGAWFITLESDEALHASQTVWDLRADNVCTIAELYYNATQGICINCAYEMHTYTMDALTHYNTHFTDGTSVVNGLAVSPTNALPDILGTVEVTQGKLMDEDILIQILDGVLGSAKFTQELTSLSAYKYWRIGASDIYRDNYDENMALMVGGIPQVNPFDGSVYSLADATNNFYSAMWIVYTTDVEAPVQVWVGQAESSTLNNAIEINGLASMSFGAIPIEEIRVAYRLMIRRQGSSYTLYQVDNFLTDPQTGLPTSPANSHGSLLGLGDDDHTQYYNLTRLNLWKISDIDPDLLLKIDKDYEAYTALLSGGIAATDIILVRDISTGETKKMTANEFKSWLALTGDIFDPTLNYASEGLGAYKSAMQTCFDVTLDTLGRFKVSIKTQIADQRVWVQFPVITSNTNKLELSTDDGTIYYDVLVNGGNIYAQVLSEKLVKLKFDGSNFILDLDSLFQELTYDEIINSIFGTVNPINGIPSLNNVYGLLLNQQALGSFETDVTTTGIGDSWIDNTSLPTFTLDNTIKRVGTYSQKIVSGANDTIQLYSLKPFVSGNKYRIKGYAYITSMATDGAIVGLDLRILSGATTKASLVFTTTDSLTLNEWIEVNTVYTADGTEDRIMIRSSGSSGDINNITAYVDEVSFIDITNTPISTKSASDIDKMGIPYFEGIKYITDFELQSVGVQRFDKASASLDSQLSETTGEISANEGRYVSEFISVEPSTDYYFNNRIVRTVFYDGNQEYLEGALVISEGGTISTSSSTAYLKFSSDMDDIDTAQLEEGTAFTSYTAYNSPTTPFELIDFNGKSIGDVATGIRDKAYPKNGKWWKDELTGTELAVAIGATINTTSIPTIKVTTGIFHAYDTVNNEDQYGVYGDVLTLTGTATVYFQLATIPDPIELEANGSLIQESNTTLIQGNSNFATEYDITFNLDLYALLLSLSKRVIQLEEEVTDLKEALALEITNRIAADGVQDIDILANASNYLKSFRPVYNNNLSQAGTISYTWTTTIDELEFNLDYLIIYLISSENDVFIQEGYLVVPFADITTSFLQLTLPSSWVIKRTSLTGAIEITIQAFADNDPIGNTSVFNMRFFGIDMTQI